MSGLGTLVGLFAIALGFLGTVAPQLLFTLRHPISVTADSQLNQTGVVLYRIGGVITILFGLFVLFAGLPTS